MSEETITHECGVKTSPAPRYDLIPTAALDALAARYADGMARYSDDNWRKGIGDVAYTVHRLNHVIQHAKAAIDKLEGKSPNDGEDDGAAIMWGGALLVESKAALAAAKPQG